MVPLASFNALRRAGEVLPPLEDIQATFPQMTDLEAKAYTEIKNSPNGLRIQTLAGNYPDLFEVEQLSTTRGTVPVAYTAANAADMQLAKHAIAQAGPDAAKRAASQLPDVVELVADPLPITQRKVSEALASRGGVAPAARNPLERLGNEVLERLGYQADVEPRSHGKTVRVTPKNTKAIKLLGSLPFIGAGIDVAMAASDVMSGDYSDAAAHLGDAALGATGIGEAANLAASLLTDSDGFVSLAEDVFIDDA
jgi:plasmid stabilization system protein ParE